MRKRKSRSLFRTLGPVDNEVTYVFSIFFLMFSLLFFGYSHSFVQNPTSPVIARKPIKVSCLSVKTEKHTIFERYYGRVIPFERVSLSFQVTGKIQNIEKTKVGDRVHELEAVAQVDVERDVSMLKEAQVYLKDAEQKYERTKKLFMDNATTKSDLEKVETALQQAQAAVETSLVSIRQSVLRSPISGRVESILVENGENVLPQQIVMTIIDIDKVKMNIGVSEKKISLFKEGTEVDVYIEQLSKSPYKGVVSVVPPSSFQDSGMFEVEIVIPNGGEEIKPGMIAIAEVPMRSFEAYKIPSDSVFLESGGNPYAFFAESGYTVGLNLGEIGSSHLHISVPVARKVPVEVVYYDEDYYVKPTGYTNLIVDGSNMLIDGTLIDIVETR